MYQKKTAGLLDSQTDHHGGPGQDHPALTPGKGRPEAANHGQQFLSNTALKAVIFDTLGNLAYLAA